VLQTVHFRPTELSLQVEQQNGLQMRILSGCVVVGASKGGFVPGDRIYFVGAEPVVEERSAVVLDGQGDSVLIERAYRLLRTAPQDKLGEAKACVRRVSRTPIMFLLYDAHRIKRTESAPPWLAQLPEVAEKGPCLEVQIAALSKYDLSSAQNDAMLRVKQAMVGSNTNMLKKQDRSVYPHVTGEMADAENGAFIFNTMMTILFEQNLKMSL
jgi:hypothetical protein